MKVIKFTLDPGGKSPVKKTLGAACFDCFANLEKTITIKPLETILIPLGFRTEIPSDTYIEVRGRSGNALNGLWINTGTVDSDYRGTLHAIVLNASNKDIDVNPNDRIAQIILKNIVDQALFEVINLSDTARGSNGFGSTGK